MNHGILSEFCRKCPIFRQRISITWCSSYGFPMVFPWKPPFFDGPRLCRGHLCLKVDGRRSGRLGTFGEPSGPVDPRDLSMGKPMGKWRFTQAGYGKTVCELEAMAQSKVRGFSQLHSIVDLSSSLCKKLPYRVISSFAGLLQSEKTSARWTVIPPYPVCTPNNWVL